MYKLIFACCLILALAHGEPNQHVYTSPSHEHHYNLDDYIELNQRHYSQVIDDFDEKLNHANSHLSNNIDQIHLIGEFVEASVTQFENHLRPLRMLSSGRRCISMNQLLIKRVSNSEKNVADCISEDGDVYTKPIFIRDELGDYYAKTFERAIKNCRENTDTDQSTYKCLSKAISDADAYTHDKQQEFNQQMEISDCEAERFVKRALDCSFDIQFSVASAINKAELSIGKCIFNDCQECKYKCPGTLQLLPHEIYNEEVVNPFYNTQSNHSCFILTFNSARPTIGHSHQYATPALPAESVKLL